jgi:tRNA threonylcarbamoyladenosine biosynthesis protein TsaB
LIVLGLDTSTPATVVGLRFADGRTLQARDDPHARQRPGHATRLLPLAYDLFAEAGICWSELQRIAVGVGPGTFTGLRIGIATARGLAQSLGVELVGVSSLRALAYGAEEQSQRVLAVTDARRGEVFVGAYDDGQELIAPQALCPGAVAELLESTAVGTQAEEWLALGDGAVLYREAFERVGVRVADDHSEYHQIQGPAICELGERVPASGEAVVPDYLRRPDAEITLEGAAS